MADLTENLVTYINTLTDYHVGEIVPQHVGTGHVWLQQSGQSEREDLAAVPVIDVTYYDVEIASADLDDLRDETETIKAAFRNLGKFPSGFESVVEMFRVTDHDDDYLFQSIDADSRLHVAALSLSAHHSN